MNPLTVPVFLTLFPEFAKYSTPTLETWLPIAISRVPAATWKNNMMYAQALLLAHMLTASGRSGQGSGGGAVSNESVGDLSRGFTPTFVAGSGDAELGSTRYGMDFIALRRETIINPTVTGYTTLPPLLSPGQFCDGGEN